MAGSGEVPPVLSEQARAALWEGVRLCLERWSALQLAVDHGFGSASQVQQLHSDVFKWLTATKGPLYIDELENLLDDKLVELFCTEAEDGSIEEVADQVMALHEECLHGDFSTVDRLAQAVVSSKASLSRSQQIHWADDSEDVDEDEDDVDDDGAMDVSTSDSELAGRVPDSLMAETSVPRKGIQLSAEEREAGWEPVPFRGRRKTGGS